MSNTLIILFCVVLIAAYLFDLTARRTRIPSVILLLLLGWSLHQGVLFLQLSIPDFAFLLPILGTVGLILIVLEGSLELELNASRAKLMRLSSVGAVVALIAGTLILAFGFHHFGNYPLRICLVNAIPLSIMSSAIAIPTVRNLKQSDREYIVYESSISDIAGVLFFNFIVLNESVNGWSFLHFGIELLVILAISFISTLALSYLMNRIDHHVKFVPIVCLVILIYSLSKIYHLPGLIFILVFGLFLGNLDELKGYKWIKAFHTEEFDKEVMKFKDLTYEATFLVRAVFFIVFGFLINTSDIINLETLGFSVVVACVIFIIRFVQLKISKLPLMPLLFIAPRGLITILLFLSITPDLNLPLINNSLIIQVILITALILMFGMIGNKGIDLASNSQTHVKEETALREIN